MNIAEQIQALSARLEECASRYGNKSFVRPVQAIVDEIESELIDVPGWLYVLWSIAARKALQIVRNANPYLEVDGEMQADTALSQAIRDRVIQKSRLSGEANVLVMPAFHSASISTKMLQTLGGSTVIGPLLVGLDKPVQIVPLGAKDSDIVNMAARVSDLNIGGAKTELSFWVRNLTKEEDRKSVV